VGILRRKFLIEDFSDVKTARPQLRQFT